MNAFKLTFVAVALTFGSTAAYANTQNARGPIAAESNTVDQAGASHIVESNAGPFGRPSRRTIFGHDAEASRYVSSGETVNVWGHKLDR